MRVCVWCVVGFAFVCCVVMTRLSVFLCPLGSARALLVRGAAVALSVAVAIFASVILLTLCFC